MTVTNSEFKKLLSNTDDEKEIRAKRDQYELDKMLEGYDFRPSPFKEYQYGVDFADLRPSMSITQEMRHLSIQRLVNEMQGCLQEALREFEGVPLYQHETKARMLDRVHHVVRRYVDIGAIYSGHVTHNGSAFFPEIDVKLVLKSFDTTTININLAV